MSEKMYNLQVKIEVEDADGTLHYANVEVSKRFSDTTKSDEIVHQLLSKAEQTAYNLLERRLRLARGDSRY